MEHIKDILKGLHTEFGWFIWGLVGIGIIWALNGGTNAQSAHEGAYLKPPAPLDTGEAYGTYYAGTPQTQGQKLNLPQAPANIIRGAETLVESFFGRTKKAQQIHVQSLLAETILIDGKAGAQATDPNTEYIRLVASSRAKAPIDISNLSLAGTSFDGRLPIPTGVSLPVIGTNNTQSDIILDPGDRAIISSGLSPLGYSFRVNICSGYLGEHASFTPALRNDCPDGSNCKSDAVRYHTYNACVDAHKNDQDFYTNEWRVFLGQSTELWKYSGEIIQLVDPHGNVVDALTY